MNDARGDFLGLPHGTKPTAVIANEIYKLVPLKAMQNSKIERRPYCTISDHESSSVALNELVMNARRL